MITFLIWCIGSVWILTLWRKYPDNLSQRQKRAMLFMLSIPMIFLGMSLESIFLKQNTDNNTKIIYLVIFTMIAAPFNYGILKLLHNITLTIRK